jgi:hypothetical protein
MTEYEPQYNPYHYQFHHFSNFLDIMVNIANESELSLAELYRTKNLSLEMWRNQYEPNKRGADFLKKVAQKQILVGLEVVWASNLGEGYPAELLGAEGKNANNWLNQTLHHMCYSATIRSDETFTVNYDQDYTCLYVTQINPPGIPAPHCLTNVSKNRTTEVDYTKEFIDINQICHIALTKLAEKFPYYLEFPSEAEVLVKGAAIRDFDFSKNLKK